MALCGPPHNGHWICGPNPAGFWDHHVVVVPSEWQRYRRYLVVRNPLTRLVGLWLHYSWAAKQPEQPMLRRDLTWPQFVLACAEDHPGSLRWFYRWTITRLIEPVDRLDGTIRYERLVDDLRSVLEAGADLSAAYHDLVDPAEWYGDDRIRNLATAWGQADRLRFGVLTLGPSHRLFVAANAAAIVQSGRSHLPSRDYHHVRRHLYPVASRTFGARGDDCLSKKAAVRCAMGNV